ncbi:hypothetical protein [Hyalangium rubrum]|uniref:Lipoprotein n=1 Tax=Hyalangium rubrum TaxID=3103134 RepID=A0ABU5HB29_9BACT|nr:hypothetical protein [Hyalangium sp. s54d21]MDY7229330.1 hypothetical protein [Hyalangium sp. s54d21]
MKVPSEKSRACLLGAILLTLSSGCDPTGAEAEPTQPTVDPIEEATDRPNPERRGIGAMPMPPPPNPSQQALAVDPRRSLVVTDQAILARFTFQGVMNQLVATSGTPTTALDLFHQWWDTARPGPGLGLGPNCNSPGIANMNGFPYACPRAEGNQATVDPFINPTTSPNAYLPIGLFNRFDLASTSGADCGEYRVVFAKRSGLANPQDRNLIIFEAALPNPTPSLGLEGCRPVVNFWSGLSADPDVNSRGAKLRDFYFQGLPGFMPVLHIDNLGNRASNTGQVRTNQFMQANWMLREFKIRRDCSAGPCVVRFLPVTVKTNPGGTLFNPGSGHALAANFQNTVFPAQVSSLAINDINRFTLSVPDSFNSGQSDSQGPMENHYVNQLGAGPSSFRTNIQTELTTLSSTLTPENVVARSMALSCAGCHQLSNGANLGGGITWPLSLRFVHISEQTDPGPDGPRHRISPALNTVFIPHRKAVLETFLNASCGDAVCDAWETASVCGADCP